MLRTFQYRGEKDWFVLHRGCSSIHLWWWSSCCLLLRSCFWVTEYCLVERGMSNNQATNTLMLIWSSARPCTLLLTNNSLMFCAFLFLFFGKDRTSWYRLVVLALPSNLLCKLNLRDFKEHAKSLKIVSVIVSKYQRRNNPKPCFLLQRE